MRPADRLILASIGFVQGVVFWLASAYWPGRGPAGAWVMAAVACAAAGGLVAQFAWTGRDRLRLQLVAGLTGLVFALPTLWVWWQLPPQGVPYQGDEGRAWTWPWAALLALYALGPYLQIYQRDGRLRFPYPDLFSHSWHNFFIGVLGLVFLGVFWALVLLWGALFEMVGVEIFETIFESKPFTWITSATVFAYGVARGREGARVTEAARGAVLAIFRVLLPFVAVMGLLFLVTLPFTGLAPLWGTHQAARLLITLIAFTVLFLNATVEDGSREPPRPAPVRHAVAAAVLALPVFAALALRALQLRIDQHGLTPGRFIGLVVAVVACLYALGYAGAVLARRTPWMSAIRPVNVALSFVVIAAALLLHTPALDPIRASVRSQYARLARGHTDAESFDYAYLRFQLGRLGFEALDRLEQLADHPQHAAIRAGVGIARALERYTLRPQHANDVLRDEHLVLAPGLAAVPAGLTAAIAAGLGAANRSYCVRDRSCTLIAVDLDGDGAAEYCLLPPFHFVAAPCYARRAEGWTRLGELAAWSPGAETVDWTRLRTLGEQARAEGATPVPSPWADVHIGTTVLRLKPPANQ